MASTATFSRKLAHSGISIPVQNTFIHFDIHGLASASASSRVRCKSCPYSPSFHIWEDSAQELCHAMAPPTPPQQHRPVEPPAAERQVKAPAGQTRSSPSEPASPVSSADDDGMSEMSTASSDGASKLQAWTDVSSRKRGAKPQQSQPPSQPPKQPPQPQQPQQPRQLQQPRKPQAMATPTAAAVQTKPAQRTALPAASPRTPVAAAKARAVVPSRQEPASPAARPQPAAVQRTTSKGEGKGKGMSHFVKIEVGIKDDPHFRVVQKLIGPGGKHMKDITAEAPGAKIWMIGKGSRSWEDDVGPLVVCVGSHQSGVFENAIRLVNELVGKVRDEYRKFKGEV